MLLVEPAGELLTVTGTTHDARGVIPASKELDAGATTMDDVDVPDTDMAGTASPVLLLRKVIGESEPHSHTDSVTLVVLAAIPCSGDTAYEAATTTSNGMPVKQAGARDTWQQR